MYRLKPPVAGVVLAFAALGLTGCLRGTANGKSEGGTAVTPSSRVRVAVASPERVRMDRGFELTGEFRPWQQADLHAKVAGYLRTLRVDIGSRVRAGQEIATLENPELEAERVEAAAGIRQADSEERRMQALIQRARAQLDVAKVSTGRLMAVNQKERGLVSGQEMDEATAREQAAQAELANTEAAAQSAKQATETAKARLGRIQAMLTYSRITAPFDGVVTKRYVDPGNMVQAGINSQTQAIPVVQVSSLDRLRLSVVVPETAVPDVRQGTEVEVVVPALNQTFRGTIARFTSTVAAASRTMEAQIDVANPAGRISPGMMALVRLNTRVARDVVAVPLQAISRRGGQTFVLTVNNAGKVEERRIEAGMETASAVEVIAGLTDRERVIVGNRTLIQPGQTVEVGRETVN